MMWATIRAPPAIANSILSPRAVGPPAFRGPCCRDIDAAAAAFDHVLGLDARRGAARPRPRRLLRALQRLPHLIDPVDVFEAVPDDEDEEDKEDELAEADAEHMAGLREPVPGGQAGGHVLRGRNGSRTTVPRRWR